MSNTHILIPITEQLEEAINEAYLEDVYQAVSNGKRISLDEKDIEEKAKKYCKTEPMFSPASLVKCYKQALKDILS